MTWTLPGSSGSSTSLRLGPEQNTFTGADLAAAEAARDAYFASNPTILAAYDSNSNNLIRLVYTDTTTFEGRQMGAWVDYSPVVQGQPGSVASLVNVPVGQVPYKLPDGTFGGSRMRVLDDGSLLAPPNFGVESGSVKFGDVLTVSEAAGFLAISNHLNAKNYTLLDYPTPRDAASGVPSQFRLIEAEHAFVAQGIFSTQLISNPLIVQYTVQNTARTNALTFKTFAAMSNVRFRIVKQTNDVTVKYVPNKEAWETEVGGLTWGVGDNTFDFADTPIIFNAGDVIRFEVYATSVSLLGNSLNVPYLVSTLQLAEFHDVVMDDQYTATDVRNKLAGLAGTNRIDITSIKNAVTSVAGRTGDVLLSASDVSGLASVATTGAYTSLSGLPTIPTNTNQLTNGAAFITAAAIPVTSVAGRTGAITLNRADVGLPNVDNTADIDKPTSTAQQTSIDAKMAQHNAAADPHPFYTTTIEAAAAAPVQSVNALTGNVVISTGNITEVGNLFYTDARVDTRVPTVLSSLGYVVKSVAGGGAGASVFNNTTAGVTTLRNINGTGLVTVTQNLNDITVATPSIASGTYTPTLTNVTNVSSNAAFQANYIRVGNIVTVSGKVTIDPVNNAATTRLGISLPVASNLGAEEDCAGVASCTDTQQAGGVMGDAANNRATIEFFSTSTTARDWFFTFTYEII